MAYYGQHKIKRQELLSHNRVITHVPGRLGHTYDWAKKTNDYVTH